MSDEEIIEKLKGGYFSLNILQEDPNGELIIKSSRVAPGGFEILTHQGDTLETTRSVYDLESKLIGSHSYSILPTTRVYFDSSHIDNYTGGDSLISKLVMSGTEYYLLDIFGAYHCPWRGLIREFENLRLLLRDVPLRELIQGNNKEYVENLRMIYQNPSRFPISNLEYLTYVKYFSWAKRTHMTEKDLFPEDIHLAVARCWRTISRRMDFKVGPMDSDWTDINHKLYIRPMTLKKDKYCLKKILGNGSKEGEFIGIYEYPSKKFINIAKIEGTNKGKIIIFLRKNNLSPITLETLLEYIQ